MTTFASDWRFKNYSDWHGNLVSNGKKTANRLYDEYHSDLVKIKAYSGSPHTIKGFVGRLLNKKVVSEQKYWKANDFSCFAVGKKL
jgi:hypothetical protein